MWRGQQRVAQAGVHRTDKWLSTVPPMRQVHLHGALSNLSLGGHELFSVTPGETSDYIGSAGSFAEPAQKEVEKAEHSAQRLHQSEKSAHSVKFGIVEH